MERYSVSCVSQLYSAPWKACERKRCFKDLFLLMVSVQAPTLCVWDEAWRSPQQRRLLSWVRQPGRRQHGTKWNKCSTGYVLGRLPFSSLSPPPRAHSFLMLPVMIPLRDESNEMIRSSLNDQTYKVETKPWTRNCLKVSSYPFFPLYWYIEDISHSQLSELKFRKFNSWGSLAEGEEVLESNLPPPNRI